MQRIYYSHWVYVIENNSGEIYIGRTEHLIRRLKQHRSGKCKTTAAMKDRNFKLVHTWKVPNLSYASKLELYLQRKSISEVLDIILDIPYWGSYLEKEVRRIQVDDLCREQLIIALETIGK